MTFWVWIAVATAAPFRSPPVRPERIQPEIGRRSDVLIVKLAEGTGLSVKGGQLQGAGDHARLDRLLAGARPVFQRSASVLRTERARVDPNARLADLSLYLRLELPDAVQRGNALLADPRVETVYLAPEPVAPPIDIPPETPDFSGDQGYREPGPGGFEFTTAHTWPGGTGANVTIADVEYGFSVDHEDLVDLVPGPAWGWDSGWYLFHGNAVLGQLIGADNGYGVTGLVPDVDTVMISPFSGPDVYDVAAAIDGAAALLDAGDVLLIEQQGLLDGQFAPVEADPAVFDAIALAVAKGIVVVEPAGNGGLDLDDPQWEGWFDRTIRDSGAIIVGGGASPHSDLAPRSWVPEGSSYGSRVDVQGWYDNVVTTSWADGGDTWTDLFFPDHDARQAYTAQFAGTSAAAPMVAAVAAVVNSVAWETRGEPWDPMALRAAMVSTGTPQSADDPFHIGPQPNLRRLLQTWAVR